MVSKGIFGIKPRGDTDEIQSREKTSSFFGSREHNEHLAHGRGRIRVRGGDWYSRIPATAMQLLLC